MDHAVLASIALHMSVSLLIDFVAVGTRFMKSVKCFGLIDSDQSSRRNSFTKSCVDARFFFLGFLHFADGIVLGFPFQP